MADQPITSLPVKTSSGMAATDYLLGIDSAEGYQMLIQDLGDYIIQHATSSLVGQSQTLASVISNTYNLRDTIDIPGNADMNTYKTEGMYYASNSAASTASHSPVKSAFKMIVERVLNRGSKWYRQTIIAGNAIDIVYTRYTVDNGATWSAWTQKPTRAEINALNSKTIMNQYRKETGSSAGNVTFTPVSATGLRYTGLLFITQNDGSFSLYAVACKINTSAGFVTKLAGSNVAVNVATSTGVITVPMATWSRATLLVDSEFT